MKRYEVIITPNAEAQFLSICNYILTKWSYNSKQNFIKRLDEKIDQISIYPESCPESQIIPNVRKAVVDHRTSFFYLVLKDRIDIVSMFDNSQSDDRKQSELT